MAFVDFSGLASLPRNGPYVLLDARGVAGGIRILARRIFAAAANVNNSFAVVREAKRRQFLAVIFGVAGQPASLEVRPFGDPDIAFALLVEGPSQSIAGLCGSQVAGERRAEHLLQREFLLRLSANRQK